MELRNLRSQVGNEMSLDSIYCKSQDFFQPKVCMMTQAMFLQDRLKDLPTVITNLVYENFPSQIGDRAKMDFVTKSSKFCCQGYVTPTEDCRIAGLNS